MNHVTQDLVLEYIEKNTNSIIVIVSEVGDPTGDSAINLVMRKAPDFRSRTICALTKPDKLRESDDMGKRVAMNGSSFTLDDNRFIVLRGNVFLFSVFFLTLKCFANLTRTSTYELLTKLVRSRWLDISRVLFSHFYGPRQSRGP